MTETKETQKLILRDTDFMSMMQRRIFNVLLVANPYDAFMLEDDGRIDEKVFEEYLRCKNYPESSYCEMCCLL